MISISRHFANEALGFSWSLQISCCLFCQRSSPHLCCNRLSSWLRPTRRSNYPSPISWEWKDGWVHHRRNLSWVAWWGWLSGPILHRPWGHWSFENLFVPAWRKGYLGCVQLVMNGLPIKLLIVLDLGIRLIGALSSLPAIDHIFDGFGIINNLLSVWMIAGWEIEGSELDFSWIMVGIPS